MLQSPLRTNLNLLSLLFATLVVAVMCCLSATAQSGTVIYRFKGDNGTHYDGASPMSPLTLGNDGALYGTTNFGGTAEICSDDQGDVYTCGTVFQLKPPTAPGLPWQESMLYSFGSALPDGLSPQYAPLAMDQSGNLYGTTRDGGLSLVNCSANSGPYWCGTVFQLIPPREPHGSWTRNLIYEFQANDATDGYWPMAGLTLDKQGNLYGTTEDDGENLSGVVFELSPGAYGDPWTETILHRFQYPGRNASTPADGSAPASSLFMDEFGNLFGTTLWGGSGACHCGTVFELSPPVIKGGGWIERVLYSFQDGVDGSYPNGLFRGVDGAFYGTTRGGGGNSCADDGWGPYCGTVFRLAQEGESWRETMLYSFKGDDGAEPYANLVSDSGGRFYGTTSLGGEDGAGTVFSLDQKGGIWVEKVMYAFKGKSDGGNPLAGLTMDNDTLYGTASGGGIVCSVGDGLYPCGTVFEITK